MLDKL